MNENNQYINQAIEGGNFYHPQINSSIDVAYKEIRNICFEFLKDKNNAILIYKKQQFSLKSGGKMKNNIAKRK